MSGKANPTEPGIYACRQWYGWRVLEWRGRWTYQDGVADWPSKALFEDWKYLGPPRQLGKPNPPPLEFDL